MKYILDPRYRFRGWSGAPYGIYDTEKRRTRFFEESLYRLLMRCDAVQEVDPDACWEREQRFLAQALQEGVIREAGLWAFLQEAKPRRTGMSWAACSPGTATTGRRSTRFTVIRRASVTIISMCAWLPRTRATISTWTAESLEGFHPEKTGCVLSRIRFWVFASVNYSLGASKVMVPLPRVIESVF